MATNGNESNTDHRATYEGFTSFAKWGTIAIVIALVLLYIFLV